jgi:hypothetical protein
VPRWGLVSTSIARLDTFLEARVVPRTLLLAVLMLFSIGLMAPVSDGGLEGVPRTQLPQMEAEYWWPVVLHKAFLEQRVFGRDVVFPYGPWSFVIVGYHPDTWELAVAVRILLVGISTLYLWELVRHRSQSVVRAALVVVGLPVIFRAAWPDPFWLWLPFLMLLHCGERPEKRNSPFFLIFTFAAALLSLTKFSLFILFVVVIGAISIDDISARKLPRSLIAYCMGIAFFWILAAQPPGAFDQWVATSLEIVSGYEGAFSFETPTYQLQAMAPFLFTLIVFFIVGSARDVRRRGVRALWWRAAWAFALLALFRWGFVRADHFHFVPACGVLASILITWLSVTVSDASTGPLRWTRGVVALTLIVPLAVVSLGTSDGLFAQLEDALKSSGRGLIGVMRWNEREKELERRFDVAMSHSIERDCGRNLLGRADSYPHPDPLVLRDEIDYVPRPIYLSYQANTRALAEINAADLRANPRDSIAFRIVTIDHRFPSLDDGASWPTILSDYRIEELCGPYLLLERRADAPRPSELRFVGAVRGSLGEEVAFPDVDAPLLASVDLGTSVPGRVMGFLYKTPELSIEIRDVRGRKKSYRFIREAAQTPFLVSPVVESTHDFASLMSGDPGKRARGLTIDSKRASRRSAFHPAFEVRFFELETRSDEKRSAGQEPVPSPAPK